MYPGGGDQLLDVGVPGQVGLTDVVRQVEQQLPAQHLIAVHVGHVLHLRLRQLMVPGVVGELEHVERDSLHGWLRQGVEARDVRTFVVNLNSIIRTFDVFDVFTSKCYDIIAL